MILDNPESPLHTLCILPPLSCGHRDSDGDIFPNFDRYSDWAICKGKITKDRFPNLQAPNREGGCVRYYQGIDMTGVVTEQHFFFKDGFKTACDCAAKCLEEPNKCMSWVWKHTCMPEDGGKGSCTQYSSPNLPTNVTLKYDLANSKGAIQTVNKRTTVGDDGQSIPPPTLLFLIVVCPKLSPTPVYSHICVYLRPIFIHRSQRLQSLFCTWSYSPKSTLVELIDLPHIAWGRIHF
ncbi:hypothetical protein QL093DRAFT_2026751 [Fusarium oxysporum]|nr:hypothetical protein QL093DRAFT_2026751 [Fusarium oxysporum]